MLKALAGTTAIDASMIAGLSGHSLRVGAAPDLMANGHHVLQIMAAGERTSVNGVGQYVREVQASPWA